MPAHLEVTGGIIRYSANPNWQYGDPYDLAIYVLPLDENTVMLKGFAGEPPFKARRDIRDLLRARGWQRVRWERIKDGRVMTVEFQI